MKISFSTVLTVILCIALVVGAIGLGTVRGWSDEREKVLMNCVTLHNDTKDLRRSVAECRSAVADYDHRLETELTGRIAGLLGVEPIGDSLEGLHEQLLQESQPEEIDRVDLEDWVEELLEEHVDTSLSLGKVILTILLLMVIFGKRGRKKGFTLGKLLAGFGLFKLWKRD